MVVNEDFIKSQYRSGIKNYTSATLKIALWQSEKYIFKKYLNRKDNILDLGCGTGRTTFPLFKLGFENIIGVDLTPEMINAAKELNSTLGENIHFETGNACQLRFRDAEFDRLIFSFNGLMSIPKQERRDAALKEIHRVLKKNGTFIFTTHDRNKEPSFFDFWKSEWEKWQTGKQNPNLFDFGDMITLSKNEEREIFIHIPNEEEIKERLEVLGFEIVETFYRSDKFTENELVKKHSGECRFWVARKM